MKRKILVSLMILAAMIMTACGGTATSDIETDGASGTTTGVSTEQKDPRDIDDGLPDTDFDGREFRILTYEMLIDDYIADTENGGLIRGIPPQPIGRGALRRDDQYDERRQQCGCKGSRKELDSFGRR